MKFLKYIDNKDIISEAFEEVEAVEENWMTSMAYTMKKASLWVGIPSAILFIFGGMGIVGGIGFIGLISALLGYNAGKGLQKLGLSDIKKGLEIFFESEPMVKYVESEVKQFEKTAKNTIRKLHIKAHLSDDVPENCAYEDGSFAHSFYYSNKYHKKDYSMLKTTEVEITSGKYKLSIEFDENDLYFVRYETYVIITDKRYVKEWNGGEDNPEVTSLYCVANWYLRPPTVADMKKFGVEFEDKE